MSHISGHWDGSSVGAALSRSTLGILTLPLKSGDFKILFVNNKGIKPEDVTDKEVGFHLQLIKLETTGSEEYFGLAYDVIPWGRHRNVDNQSTQQHNKPLEDLTDEEMDRLKNELTNLSEKDVVDQTKTYKKTNHFTLLYNSNLNTMEKRIDWIKTKVKNYDDIGPIQRLL